MLADLATWWQHFRVLQASEVWACHGQWVEEVEPTFGPGIRERFQMAKGIKAEDVASAAAARDEIMKHLDTLLHGGVLMVPTAPGPGVLLKTPPAELDSFRTRALSLTSIAGLGSLPQINLPIAAVDGAPVGLGLIGARGSDEKLLELAAVLARIVPSQPARNAGPRG